MRLVWMSAIQYQGQDVDGWKAAGYNEGDMTMQPRCSRWKLIGFVDFEKPKASLNVVRAAHRTVEWFYCYRHDA